LLNTSRILEVVRKLSRLKPCIPYIVRIDPQYWAIYSVVSANPGYTVYAVANALVSYQLIMRGEEYWNLLAERLLASKPSLSELKEWFREFLARYNPRSYSAKYSRITRFTGTSLYRELSSQPLKYCSDLSTLNSLLGSIYGDPGAKTVVFATKIYYYACLASGCEALLDFDIDIPVDRRNASITASLGLLNISGVSVETLLSKYRSVIASAWRIISNATGIPPLLVDTITWAVIGNPTAAKSYAYALPHQCSSVLIELNSVL